MSHTKLFLSIYTFHNDKVARTTKRLVNKYQ